MLIVDAKPDGVEPLVQQHPIEIAGDPRRRTRQDQSRQRLLDGRGDQARADVEVAHEPAQHQRVGERDGNVGEHAEREEQRNDEAQRESHACSPPDGLGPVHTMSTSANGCHGVPIEALDEAQTGCLREESNEEWRPRAPVPFGLRPKWPCALLQSLAGQPARLRLCASLMAISAVQRTCRHSVNRPSRMAEP